MDNKYQPRFPRTFTIKYAKEMLYHANCYCRFGQDYDNTIHVPDQADIDAANILHDKFKELVNV